MQYDPENHQTGLWSSDDGPVMGVFPDISIWGKRWVQILAKQMGIIQAWVAQVDEDFSVRWVANSSVFPLPAQFSSDVLQAVIRQRKRFTFIDHMELLSGGLFPLTQNEQVIGLIGLISGQTDFFKSETIQWIHTLTNLLLVGVSPDGTSGRREQQVEQSITRAIQSSLDVRDALHEVMATLTAVLTADAITTLRYLPTLGRFELLGTIGLEKYSLAKLHLHLDIGLGKRSFEDWPLWIENLQTAPPDLQPITRFGEEGYHSYLALPLIAHGDLFGVLEVAWKQPQYTIRGKMEFLKRVAEQIAFAMERTTILRDLRQSNSDLMARYTAMIAGLSRALELRDLETEGHTRRVSLLTMELVQHMQIPTEQWDSIRQGALLHDIGKIGVPDAILLKPGSLTAQERKVMQQHVQYGYNILAPITNSRHTLDITLYHHERWDGKGYPNGLAAEQIPLVARLFSVMDVFDALTSDRPYRTAWDGSKALKYISAHSGSQFDPQIVQLFLEVIGRLGNRGG
jgi:HD-GYP domain-containing protein (c-di-GMP phosphodiesterase class II)